MTLIELAGAIVIFLAAYFLGYRTGIEDRPAKPAGRFEEV